jgi:RND family efflux transporter MFP subunit
MTGCSVGALALVASASFAAGENARPLNTVVVDRCAISYRHSTDVGGNHSSGATIQELHVRPGDRVKAGQVLGRFFNRVEQAAVKLAEVKLNNAGIALRQKEAVLEVEKLKLGRLERLRARNTLLTSIQDFQAQQLAVKTAELDRQTADGLRAMAAGELEQAKASLMIRDIICPHDGVVSNIYKNPGETVAITEPVVRVVEIDQLRITGYLNAGDGWKVREGHPVRITPSLGNIGLPIEQETFVGKVTFVDSEVDPKSRTVKCFADVVNRSTLLRAGLECRMEISPNEAPAPTPAVPRN